MMNNEILHLDEFSFFLMYCEQRSVSPPAGIVCLYISICYHCDNSILNHSTCRTDPSFIASKNILHLKPLLLVFILNPFCLFLIPQISFTLKGFYLCHCSCILLFPSHSHIPSKEPVLI